MYVDRRSLPRIGRPAQHHGGRSSSALTTVRPVGPLRRTRRQSSAPCCTPHITTDDWSMGARLQMYAALLLRRLRLRLPLGLGAGCVSRASSNARQLRQRDRQTEYLAGYDVPRYNCGGACMPWQGIRRCTESREPGPAVGSLSACLT